MDERDANIDLVFRNGFRNLEVLPPPGVWDHINPVISRKQRNALILRRAAASVALIMALGGLIYEWNSENPQLSLNQSPVNRQLVPLVEPVPSGKVEKSGDDGNKIADVSEINTIQNSGIKRDETGISRIDNLPAESYISVKETSLQSLIDSPANIPSPRTFFPEDYYTASIKENKEVKMADRWSVAAMASPTYFSQFKFGKDDLAKQMMASEQPLVSYSGGLALTYKINKRFSVQSGLFYSSVGQQINGISSFGGFRKYDNTKGSRNFEVLTSSGVVYTENADVFLVDEASSRVMTQFTNDIFDPEKANLDYLNNTLKQNYSYLELPVIVRYKLIDKTLDINLIGGLSYNFLVNNSVYTVSEGSRYAIGKTEGLSIMTFSSSLGMGMEYNFSGNISVNLEPTFRYYLNPFRNIEVSDIHPYSFGIFSGISFRF